MVVNIRCASSVKGSDIVCKKINGLSLLIKSLLLVEKLTIILSCLTEYHVLRFLGSFFRSASLMVVVM